ncbi:MAG TPA: hypothetical protein VG013_19760 [Gemmataceae bacterium]|jgi:hypothetical protein|nr:hypothetical protein [Gemmataceae bacterium]
MRVQMTKRPGWALLASLVLAGAGGCGEKRSYQDYIPSEDAARRALEATLTAWQHGRQSDKVEAGSQTIQVLDSKWKSGQQLDGYEILSAEPGDGPTWFSVRLKLKRPSRTQEVRYVVVGKQPALMVFREEDYKQAGGGGM